MLTLAKSGVEFSGNGGISENFICKVTQNKHLIDSLKIQHAFLCTDENVPEGFGLYVRVGGRAPTVDDAYGTIMNLGSEFSYLEENDIIRVSPLNRSIRVLFRQNANANSILLTERCNHYCLMCSQPPRNVDDSYIVDEVLETIRLVDPRTKEIGFTGGEPTLLGGELINILRTAKSYLPQTAVHILSNGRRFANEAFAESYSGINNDRMMVGIPIYSDVSTIHDYIVQSDGAFDETIRGILNLKRYFQKVEIRVVIHKQSYERLPQLAEFIGRNLTFVDHVALMGLEITGFTIANLDDLWIDPFDYQDELSKAVSILDTYRIPVSIYNHQLCTLKNSSLWEHARKSISDWKNDYLPECNECSVLDRCGGLFTFNLERHSNHIRPIKF